jgi:hypothetical protein
MLVSNALLKRRSCYGSVARWLALALFGKLALEAAWAELDNLAQTATPIEESSLVKQDVPQGILDSILNETAGLAKVGREQLVIVRAEPALWNDGSLGCAQPGNMYTQALVNGYWIIIKARGQTYDFRADSRGSFILCPPGQGHPPSQESTK